MMRNAFEQDEFADFLQNLEHEILEIYNIETELTDFLVDKALEGLLRRYQAEQKGRNPPTLKLNELDGDVYEALKEVCEIALGRTADKDLETLAVPEMKTRTLDEVIACLKRLRQSVSTWSKEYGRRGYLDFINQFPI